MQVNVFFLSPRYIKKEYFWALFECLQIEAVFSFLPLELPEAKVGVIRSFLYTEYNQVCESQEYLNKYVESIAQYVFRYSRNDYLGRIDPKSDFAHKPTILIIADSSCGRYSKEPIPYNIHLSREFSGHVSSINDNLNNVFPYRVIGQDITSLFIKKYKNIIEHANYIVEDEPIIYRTSVFFHEDPRLTERYLPKYGWNNYDITGVHSPVWKIRRLAAKNNPMFIRETEDGKKFLRNIYTDTMFEDYQKWCEYEAEVEEERWRSGYYSQPSDYDEVD